MERSGEPSSSSSRGGATVETLLLSLEGGDGNDRVSGDFATRLEEAGVDVATISDAVKIHLRADNETLSVVELLEDEDVQAALTEAGVDATVLSQLSEAATSAGGADDSGSGGSGNDANENDDCSDDECGGAASISVMTTIAIATGATITAVLL